LKRIDKKSSILVIEQDNTVLTILDDYDHQRIKKGIEKAGNLLCFLQSIDIDNFGEIMYC